MPARKVCPPPPRKSLSRSPTTTTHPSYIESLSAPPTKSLSLFPTKTNSSRLETLHILSPWLSEVAVI